MIHFLFLLRHYYIHINVGYLGHPKNKRKAKAALLLHHLPCFCLITDFQPEDLHARGQSGRSSGLTRANPSLQ